jgi:hypothetical protein
MPYMKEHLDSGTLKNNTWYHVVLKHDGNSNVELYIN